MGKFLQIHPDDNVVVCLEELKKGDSVTLGNGTVVAALEDIPAGHKMAVKNIEDGKDIVKYGYAIGHATEEIKTGRWVHTHDIKTNLEGILDYRYQPDPEYVPAKKATLPIFDKIFTRIGASDDLVSGESTFMVEMTEAANAIKNATIKTSIGIISICII